MNGETNNLNNNLNNVAYDESVDVGELSPRELSQDRGEKTVESATMEQACDDFMAGVLGVPVEDFGPAEHEEFLRRAASEEGFDDETIGRFFDGIMRPDQIFPGTAEEARRATLNSMSQFSKIILDSAVGQKKNSGNDAVVTEKEIDTLLSECPTVFDFEAVKAGEIKESVKDGGDFVKEQIREFEKTVYGEEQVMYWDALVAVARQVVEFQSKN